MNQPTMPIRPGTTTTIKYNCGHRLSTTTNPVIYDPVGILCAIQLSETSDKTCGHCEKIEQDRRTDAESDPESTVDLA